MRETKCDYKRLSIKQVESENIIYKIIYNIDDIYNSLIDRVNITDYVSKLSKSAFNFVGYYDNEEVVFASLYANDLNSRIAYISLIVCTNNNRGKGYGKEMFEYLCDFAKNKVMERLRLEVNKDNFGAIKFYKAIGMEQVGCSEYGYYMEKKLI